LELLKALHGWSGSGQQLWQALAQFFVSCGLEQSVIVGLWFKRLPNQGLLVVLLCSDDLLTHCLDDAVHEDFRVQFARNFQPNASWFLASRLCRDADGNASMDQHRHGRSVVQCHLPGAAATPRAKDLTKYTDPAPLTFT